MIKAYADNVIIKLEPLPTKTASGLALVQTRKPGARELRWARVIASGPGYTTRLGAFIPNEVRPNDRVAVDAVAGQDYRMDLSVPRHNKGAEFSALFETAGEFRIVRESECLLVEPL